jgi:hypothetical protein
MNRLAKLAIGALFVAAPAWAQPPLSVPMVITVEPVGQEWVVHAMDAPFDVTATIANNAGKLVKGPQHGWFKSAAMACCESGSNQEVSWIHLTRRSR